MFPDMTKMGEGGDKLARGRIPELRYFSWFRREDTIAARTKRSVPDTLKLGMGQGSEELARGRIPELGGFIRCCRQGPSTLRTKRHAGSDVLMGKGGEELA